jgi:hypothetical protein
VLLIWGDFNILRTDGGLTFIGVVESFDVVEIRDAESGDVVVGCEIKVDKRPY